MTMTHVHIGGKAHHVPHVPTLEIPTQESASFGDPWPKFAVFIHLPTSKPKVIPIPIGQSLTNGISLEWPQPDLKTLCYSFCFHNKLKDGCS
jgi:hypothetical protein